MVRVTTETKQATRHRLLESAAAEFARAGLQRASVDEISLAAGLAKGTVYNYFASKEELFLAVVEEACARAADAGAPAEASTRERLLATLRAFFGWAREHEAFARVLVRECLMGTPELYPRVVAAEAPYVDELTATLAAGAERGEVRRDTPAETLALALAGLADLALVRYWASGASTPALEEIPELVVSLFLDGAGPRTTPDQ
jgi:AcrR family transcriptional regulator